MLEGPLSWSVLVIRRSKASRRVPVVVGAIDKANGSTERCLISLEAVWFGFCAGVGATKPVVGPWRFGWWWWGERKRLLGREK